jgi:hypothetical protein
MTTLLGVLMLAAPVLALIALAALVDRRRARRDAAVTRQIAVTDALHRRFGAIVAPVVRPRGRGWWEIAVAVPFERPAVVAGVLTSVDEVFGRAPYEVVLQRQAPPTAAPPSRRRAPLGKESLSWT